MSKNSFIPLPHDVTLELINAITSPGNQPLGIPFGFFQPENDDTIFIGSCYGYMQTRSSYTTWRDVLSNIDLAEIDLSTLREILDSISNLYKNPHNKDTWIHRHESLDREIRNFDCLMENESVSAKFSDLDDLQKAQIKIRTMWINTGSDLHDWSVSVSDTMAQLFSTGKTNEWNIYEKQSDKDEILDLILSNYSKDIPDLYVSTDESENDLYYYQEKFTNKNDQITEWINQQESLYDDNPDNTENDVIFQALNIDLYRLWDREEILPLIAESMRELESAWIDGELNLIMTDDMPPRAKRFLQYFNAVQILPGFDND